jgi:hypothetical protein
MPSTIGTVVAANYRQQQVPYSRFGSRKIIWFSIGHVSTRNSDSDIDNVEMNKLIDVIQTRAEIVTVGAPSLGENYGRFTIGVFEDTFNNGNNTTGIDGSSSAGYNAKATTLATILEDATDGDVDVQQVYLFGGLSGQQPGWSTDSDYQEYTTKAEYNDDSYLNPNNTNSN